MWFMAAMLRILPAFLGLVGGVVLLIGAAPAAQSTSFVNDLLRQRRFSATDLRNLDAGQAVVKSLETSIRKELAHFGMVHIDAPADRFVDRFRDIEQFERGDGIPQIGRSGSPPHPRDLASLTLPEKDLRELATCRPGDCQVKLPAETMTRFRNGVNWASPSAVLQAQVVARGLILELVNAYEASGNAALGQYDDHGEALIVADEFRALLAGGQLPVPVPELMAYLEEYPRRGLAGAESFFYWSMVDFGFKPTLRVNHVVIYPLAARPSGVSHVIAIKQLYASHYFQTTLELRFLIDDGRRAGRPGFYLVSLTRSRIDGTGGLTGALLRSVINRRSRSAVRGYLEHLKQQVEQTEGAPSPGNVAVYDARRRTPSNTVPGATVLKTVPYFFTLSCSN
jgi:hypothetical protein